MKRILRITFTVLGILAIFVLVPTLGQIYLNYQIEKDELAPALVRAKIISVQQTDHGLYRVRFTSLGGKNSFTMNPVNFARTVPLTDIWLHVRSHYPLVPGTVGQFILTKEATLFGVRAEFAFIPEQKSSF